MNPLTKEQARFAADHHNLVYAFLHQRHYCEDDFYDIVIFGYLHAVQKYHEREELRQYAFSTIAYRAMSQAVWSHFRAMHCPKRKAKTCLYDEESDFPDVSTFTWGDPQRHLEEKEISMACAQALTPNQSRIVRMRDNGYTITEISRTISVNPGQVKNELDAARTAVFELLHAA